MFWKRCVSVIGLACLAAGCTGLGESGLEAELKRVKSIKGFAVLNQGAQSADIAARGRRVRIEPATGLCITEDSVAVVEDGAFAMIAECGPQAGASSERFPGVLTISVSGQEGFGGNRIDSEQIDRLKRFLRSPSGRASLGRSGTAEGVEILEMRKIGDALYVHLEDQGEDQLSVFAPRFWRAFVRVNERLVLATANGFSKRRSQDDKLLSLLALQVTRMRQANLAPVHSEEVRLAREADEDLRVLAGAVAPSTPVVQVSHAPESAPRPNRRLARAEIEVALEGEPEGTPVAKALVDENVMTAQTSAVTTPAETAEQLAVGGPEQDALPPPGDAGKWAPSTAPGAPPRPS
ncbi:MAG: hypothetical protein AAFR17_06420 [Pseudomonadota bacterium]